MHDEIANISHDDTQIKLLELSEKETNQEKMKSDDLLRSKQKWPEDYANNYIWKSNDEKS